MIHHIKRLAKKKSVLGALSVMAVTGTVMGFQMQDTQEPVRYVLAAVTRSSIVTSINASGQVSAENQLDVTSNVSGAIVRTHVTLGEEVTTDTPLFEIDRKTALKSVRDAQQNIRDAEISLESSQIAYEKLLKPETGSSLLQLQNALKQSERNLAKLQEGPDQVEIMSAEAKIRTAEQNTKLAADGTTPKIVRDAYNENVIVLKSLVVTLQNVLDDADDILGIDNAASNINFTNLFSVLDQSKKIQAQTSYALAKSKIDAAHEAVDPLALREEDMTAIDSAAKIADDALEVTVALLEDVKAGLEASLTSASFSQSSLDAYRSTIQGNLNSVTNAYGTIAALEDSIADATETYGNAQTSLAQAKAELVKLMAGPDPYDIAAAQETVEERRAALADAESTAVEEIDVKTSLNTIAQRKSALQNARDNYQDALDTLNDYTVRAPFDGVIARIEAKNASQASPSTVLATLLTKAKIAEVSLNEVDVSKVAIGQKATLTFDAVESLTIAGTVSEVDMIGATNQGVVTYAVKITFLTEDDRIKSGMSVSASIVTNVRQDVLAVPNGAVHQTNGTASIDTLEDVALDATSMSTGVSSATLPQAKPVTIGISNDQFTEIREGLKEGDVIIVRTIQPTIGTTAQTMSGATPGNALRIPGVGGGGGFTGTGATFRTPR